jgi:hypothetical protein
MKDFQPLNVEQHKNLGYVEKYGPEYGHHVGAVMVMPNEFSKVQREYPILFRKDSASGRFIPVALLGFEENENLFLNAHGTWSTRYIPLAMRQGPFMIGTQQQGEEERLVVYLDVKDSRLAQGAGSPLFNADGSSANALTEIRNVLAARHEGAARLDAMIDAFLKHELLERVVIEIDLANGGTINFDAGYTVHIEKLIALKDDALTDLHRSGFLSLAYNVADSVNNIQDLIDIKNARMK